MTCANRLLFARLKLTGEPFFTENRGGPSIPVELLPLIDHTCFKASPAGL